MHRTCLTLSLLLTVTTACAADFRSVRDVPYIEAGHWRQKLDLYLPVGRVAEPVPLFVWIHGGAWLAGSKLEGAAFAYLAERGIAVASVGYRLSGDAPFPAQIDDVRAAVGWLAGRAGSFGVDSARIVVAGQSAGGHLAALLGVTAGSLAPPLPVAGVVDFYGPSDLRADALIADYRGPTAPAGAIALGKFLGGTPRQKPRLAAAASPVVHATPDDCPFLIFHGTADPIVPLMQSRRLDAALKAVAVSSELNVLEGAGHGGGPFFDVAVRERMIAFVRAVTSEE